jgi:hypothetical protein
LPPVLVLPDVRLNGPVARLIKAIAMSRNLPMTTPIEHLRPMLESLKDGETYLRGSIKSSHMREMRRQWGLLEKIGKPSYSVARQPRDILARMEEFLLLEASDGRARSAPPCCRIAYAPPLPARRSTISPRSTPPASIRSISTAGHRLDDRADHEWRSLYLEDSLR